LQRPGLLKKVISLSRSDTVSPVGPTAFHRYFLAGYMKTSDSSRSTNRTGSARREFLAGTWLAALGVTSVLTGGVASLAPATASAAPSEGPREEMEDFTYDLEKGTKGWTGPGGSAKEATVAEFPLSQSIAGVSMRLDVGGFRELHWHAIAAEWAYMLEGRVRNPAQLVAEHFGLTQEQTAMLPTHQLGIISKNG
jgi:Cupin